MNGDLRADGPGGGQPAVIQGLARVVFQRPRHGWVAGLAGAGIMVLARLVALVVALAGLAGVTAALWWAGDGMIPLVVLVYGFLAVAGGGFALGRSGRLLTRSSRPPEGPARRPWEEPGAGHARSGPQGQDDPVIAGPFGSERQEERP